MTVYKDRPLIFSMRYKYFILCYVVGMLQLLQLPKGVSSDDFVSTPSPSLAPYLSSPTIVPSILTGMTHKSIPSPSYATYRSLDYNYIPSSVPTILVYTTTGLGNSSSANVTLSPSPSSSSSSNATNNNNSSDEGVSNSSIIIYIASRVGIGVLLAVALYMAIQRQRNRPVILSNSEYLARITAHEALMNSQNQRLGLSNGNRALMATPDEVAEIINQATFEAVQIISLLGGSEGKYIIVFVPQQFTTFDNPLIPLSNSNDTVTTNSEHTTTNPTLPLPNNQLPINSSNSNGRLRTSLSSSTSTTATVAPLPNHQSNPSVVSPSTTSSLSIQRNRKWIRGNVTTAWSRYQKQYQDTYIPPTVTRVPIVNQQQQDEESSVITTTTVTIVTNNNNNNENDNNDGSTKTNDLIPTVESSTPVPDPTSNNPPSSAYTITVQVPVILRIVQPNGECLVCFEETTPLCLLGSCGHSVCTNCAKKMDKCPFCRREIETIGVDDFNNNNV